MRVVAIMAEGLANKYLSLEIARNNDVIAVFQPRSPKRSPVTKLRSFLRRWRRYGIPHIALRELATGPLPVGWPGDRRMAAAERTSFGEYEACYAEAVAPLVSTVEDVNGPEFIRRLRDLHPDVVVCSGGPIYRAPLIRASGLMLNYHTGISPIYNGSETIWWAFANSHPHLCGGTLMVMNEAVDGGDMLAHYFVAVEPHDDPASLFCKAIRGGARLYNEFLAHLRSGGEFRAVPQPRPFFYYQGYDWTVYQALAVRRQSRAMERAAYRHPERVVRYWDRSSQDEATTAFHGQMLASVLDVA